MPKDRKRKNRENFEDNGAAASLLMLGLAGAAYGGAKAVQLSREYKARMLQAVSSGAITPEEAQDIQQSVTEVQENGGTITPEVAEKAQADFGVPAAAVAQIAQESSPASPEEAPAPVTPVQEAVKEEQTPDPVTPTTPASPAAKALAAATLAPTTPVQAALKGKALSRDGEDKSDLATALTGLGTASYLGGKGTLGAEKLFRLVDDNILGHPVVLNYNDPKVRGAMDTMEQLAHPDYDPTRYVDDYTRSGGILSGQPIRMKDKAGREIIGNIGDLNHTVQERLLDKVVGVKDKDGNFIRKGLIGPNDLDILAEAGVPGAKELKEKLTNFSNDTYDYHHNRTSHEHYRRFGYGEDGGRRALMREQDEYSYGARGDDPLRRSGLSITEHGGQLRQSDPKKQKSVLGLMSKNMAELPYRWNSWFRDYAGLSLPKDKAVNVHSILERVMDDIGLREFVLDPNIGEAEKVPVIYQKLLEKYKINPDDPRTVEEYLDNVADRQYLKEKGLIPDEGFDLSQLKDPNKVKELIKDPKAREWLTNRFNQHINELDPEWAQRKGQYFGHYDAQAADKYVNDLKKQIIDIKNNGGDKKTKRERISALASEIRRVEKEKKLYAENPTLGFKQHAYEEAANRVIEKRFANEHGNKSRASFSAYDKLMAERLLHPELASASFDEKNIGSGLDRATSDRVKGLLDSMSPEEREAALRDVKLNDKQLRRERKAFQKELKSYVKEQGLGDARVGEMKGSIGLDANGKPFFRGSDTLEGVRNSGSPNYTFTDAELADNAARYIEKDLADIRSKDLHRFGRAMNNDPIGEYSKAISSYVMQDTAKAYGGISKGYRAVDAARNFFDKYHGTASNAVKGGLGGIGLGALLAGEDQKYQTVGAGAGIGALTGAQIGTGVGSKLSGLFGLGNHAVDLGAKAMGRLGGKAKLLKPLAAVAQGVAKTEGIKKLLGQGLVSAAGGLAGAGVGAGAGALGSSALFDVLHAGDNVGIGGALGALAGAYGGYKGGGAVHDMLGRGGSIRNGISRIIETANKTPEPGKVMSNIGKLFKGGERAAGINNLTAHLGKALKGAKGSRLGKGLSFLANSGALNKAIGAGIGALGGGALGAGAGALSEALQPGGGSVGSSDMDIEF